MLRDGLVQVPYSEIQKMIRIKKITRFLWRIYKTSWILILLIYVTCSSYQNPYDRDRQILAQDILVWVLKIIAYWILSGAILIIGEQRQCWNQNGISKFVFTTASGAILFAYCIVSSTYFIGKLFKLEFSSNPKYNYSEDDDISWVLTAALYLIYFPIIVTAVTCYLVLFKLIFDAGYLVSSIRKERLEDLRIESYNSKQSR